MRKLQLLLFGFHPAEEGAGDSMPKLSTIIIMFSPGGGARRAFRNWRGFAAGAQGLGQDLRIGGDLQRESK